MSVESAVCVWVCSLLMPTKCQQNKSLPCRRFKFIFIFCVQFWPLLIFAPIDWSDYYKLVATAFLYLRVDGCACVCLRVNVGCRGRYVYTFVSIYQLDFGELLKHFLFINYGWCDLLLWLLPANCQSSECTLYRWWRLRIDLVLCSNANKSALSDPDEMLSTCLPGGRRW